MEKRGIEWIRISSNGTQNIGGKETLFSRLMPRYCVIHHSTAVKLLLEKTDDRTEIKNVAQPLQINEICIYPASSPFYLTRLSNNFRARAAPLAI